MIPKIIHYIWLGTRELDETSKKCMKSWNEILPDYEIKKWGDVECKNIIYANRYAREAYESKKYAFVSDFARFDILYEHGGLYFDTDVELINNIDDIAYRIEESIEIIRFYKENVDPNERFVNYIAFYYNKELYKFIQIVIY